MDSNKVNSPYWITGGGVQSLSLAILAAIGVAFALSVTKSIMIPFVLSLFLYFILSPVRSFFVKKLKFPNWLAMISTFAVVALLLSLVFFVLFSAIQEFALGYRDYEAKNKQQINFQNTQDQKNQKGGHCGGQKFNRQVLSNLRVDLSPHTRTQLI